eukprot:Partr_v1_DN26421_c0_g1_i2_m24025
MITVATSADLHKQIEEKIKKARSDMEKGPKDLAKQQKALLDYQAEEQIAIDKLRDLHVQWIKDTHNAYGEFHSMEISRLDTIKEVMIAYTELSASGAEFDLESAKKIGVAFESCESDMDLSVFVEQNRMGSAIPVPHKSGDQYDGSSRLSGISTSSVPAGPVTMKKVSPANPFLTTEISARDSTKAGIPSSNPFFEEVPLQTDNAPIRNESNPFF